ncbi:hypothetical protein EJ07DRAFT_158396 [Lizonia empirigonia]|nr:hypothetical protein EJ07DRAFT_158396 [Lizonia empirigonia]
MGLLHVGGRRSREQQERPDFQPVSYGTQLQDHIGTSSIADASSKNEYLSNSISCLLSVHDLNNKYRDILGFCSYHAILTAMSVNCKQSTCVINWVEREDSVRKIRVVLILLQSFDVCIIGDYIWNVSGHRPSKGTHINVHQHASATLDFQTEAGPPSLK